MIRAGRTMRAEIDQREKQIGDCGLAIRNLWREMEIGKQHTIRRNRITGEAELLIAPYYKTHFIGYLSPSFVTICRQTDSRPAQDRRVRQSCRKAP